MGKGGKVVKGLNPNELAWTRIDDEIGDEGGEGWFYGLEEIDNVSVQRENGTVKFIPTDSAVTGKRKSQTKTVPQNKKQKSEVQSNTSVELEKSKADLDKDIDFNALADEEVAPDLMDSLGSWPNLNSRLLYGLKRLNFENPTDIQAQCIPVALQGRDIIGKASTGSGKTLAFGLPILEAALASKTKTGRPQALIISPTRELAHQIRDHLCAVLDQSAIAITGGLSLQKQLRLLSKSPMVVVATPGRLLEVINQMEADQRKAWQSIPSLVLDEADRLVQNNSFEDLDSILDIIGRNGKRQTLVFSATFESELWGPLTRKHSRRNTTEIFDILKKKLGLKQNAAFIDVDPEEKVASSVAQAIVECPAMEKDLYLYYFLLIFSGKSLVFVNSIDAVKRLAPLLKELGLPAFGVHSDMIQKQRLRSIERFKSTENAILIATDVAARGLDVPFVDHVIHYHIPRTGDMYVHRSGRTARAGNEGVSVSLCSPQEASGPMPRLTKLIKSKPSPLEIDYSILEQLRQRVSLAKRIADNIQMKSSEGKTSAWESKAAADLGVDLSDIEDTSSRGDLKKGKKSNKQNQSQEDPRSLRQELGYLLKQSLSPRRRYLTSGVENIAQAMLKNPTAVVPGRFDQTALEAVKKESKHKNKRAKLAL